jgi:hypothetical protein
VFAIFYDANHDEFILSPNGSLAFFSRIRCSPRGQQGPGGIERRSVPQDLRLRDERRMAFQAHMQADIWIFNFHANSISQRISRYKRAYARRARVSNWTGGKQVGNVKFLTARASIVCLTLQQDEDIRKSEWKECKYGPYIKLAGRCLEDI